MRILYLWAGKEKSGVAAFDQHQPIVSVGIDEEADLTICKDIADVTLEELRGSRAIRLHLGLARLQGLESGQPPFRTLEEGHMGADFHTPDSQGKGDDR